MGRYFGLFRQKTSNHPGSARDIRIGVSDLHIVVYQNSSWVASNRAVDDYLSIASHIRRGATLVRLRYPTPAIPRKFGFEEIGRDPLSHVDSLIAASCKCIDLSDYQIPSNVFPVIFAPNVERSQQLGLWSLEGPSSDTSATLTWLRNTLPVPVDYVIVLSDDVAAQTSDPDYPKVLAGLSSGMRLIATSYPDPFVKLYVSESRPDK